MFDDFDTMRQSDEYWPETYEDDGYFTKEEQEVLWESIKARSIDTGININDYF